MLIGWINKKISWVNVVYDGRKDGNCLDKDSAHIWYDKIVKCCTMVEHRVDEWYWGLVSSVVLPERIPNSEPWVEFWNVLKLYHVNGDITDFAYWFWQNYIRSRWDVYKENIDGYEEVIFFNKRAVKYTGNKFGYTHEEIVEMLLLREWIEGKVLPPWIEGLPPTIEIPTETIELKTLGIKIPWNYSAALRWSAFGNSKFALKHNKLLPTAMYWNQLIHGQVHSMTASRRAWKTYTLPSFIKTDMFALNGQERPSKYVYVISSGDRMKSMRQYLTSGFANEIKQWLVTPLNSENTMFMYKWENWKQTDQIFSEIQLYSAQADDVWVGDYYNYCFIDEIERSLNNNKNIISDLLSIATNEFAHLQLIGTLNKKWRHTDFTKYLFLWEKNVIDIKTLLLELYYKFKFNELDVDGLVKGSKKERKKFDAIDFVAIRKELIFRIPYSAMRLPGDEVEQYDSKEKDHIKRSLLNEWILSYITEWLCLLPEEVQNMEFEQQIVDASYFEWKKWDKIIMAYDVADRVDKWAIMFYWMDNEGNTLDMFKEIELKGDINQQYDAAKHIYLNVAPTFLKVHNMSNVYFIYDHRWIGTWLRPLFDRDNIPVICYESTNSYTWKQDERKYIVGKNYAVDLFKFNVAYWSIIISAGCTTFINEFKHFKAITNEKWYMSYNAESWHHDDFVNWALMGNWFAMDMLGAKHSLHKRTKKVEDEIVLTKWQQLEWDMLMGNAPVEKEDNTSIYDIYWY